MKKSIHGNLVVIDQLGVLLIGEHDIGKSELSLALIDRGHQLVSDDVVDVDNHQGKLIGSCPTLTHRYLLISSLGIIDVSKLFGPDAVIPTHEIHLCVELCNPTQLPHAEHPLKPLSSTINLHDISIPKLFFPATNNKNLPLLVETLVRNFRLQRDGDDTSDIFNQRYHRALKSGGKP